MAFHDAPRSAVFLAPVLDLEEALARFAVIAGLAPGPPPRCGAGSGASSATDGRS